jgi:GxxExxY protein
LVTGVAGHLTHDIVGAAIEVHRELSLRGIGYQEQVPLPVEYRGLQLECGYRLDLVVNRSVIVEVKAVGKVLPVHRAQVLTYLRLTSLRLGLLINFNVEVLRRGLHRVING